MLLFGSYMYRNIAGKESIEVTCFLRGGQGSWVLERFRTKGKPKP